jgi:hypothetical protein
MNRRAFLKVLSALGFVSLLPRKSQALPITPPPPPDPIALPGGRNRWYEQLKADKHKSPISLDTVGLNEAECMIFYALKDLGYVDKYQVWGDYETYNKLKFKIAIPELLLGFNVRKFADSSLVSMGWTHGTSMHGWGDIDFSIDLPKFFPPEMRSSLLSAVQQHVQRAEVTLKARQRQNKYYLPSRAFDHGI